MKGKISLRLTVTLTTSTTVFYVCSILSKKKRRHQVFEHRTTHHGGREDEEEQVTMCCLEDIVCFSPVIDRQSHGLDGDRQRLCDVCSKSNSVTFVTDEQNALSLCPADS